MDLLFQLVLKMIKYLLFGLEFEGYCYREFSWNWGISNNLPRCQNDYSIVHDQSFPSLDFYCNKNAIGKCNSCNSCNKSIEFTKKCNNGNAILFSVITLVLG